MRSVRRALLCVSVVVLPTTTLLPKDLPPKSTVWDYFSRWEWEGTIERIHHTLYGALREQTGREASPTTAIIDSQMAKAAQKGALRWIRPAMMRAKRWSTPSVTC